MTSFDPFLPVMNGSFSSSLRTKPISQAATGLFE
jgi:hypothetical protein